MTFHPRYINDCHIHIGANPSIRKSLSEADIYKRALISHCFVTSSEGPQFNGLAFKMQGEKFATNIRALYWIHNQSTPEDIEGYYGAKYHGSYTTIPLRSFQEQLEYLDKKHAPILIHCGMYLDGVRASATSYLHAIEIAKEYSNTKVILAHMGGSINKVIRKVLNTELPKNCYLETSGITNPIIIEEAVQTIGSQKILFGSDIPWCSFNAMLFNVLDADITDEEKEDILIKNFERLFP